MADDPTPGDATPPAPEPKREHAYASDAIRVLWDARRCIHVAECVRGLPRVFDPRRRPWVEPGAAEADAIAEVIRRCPTGALHYERLDGGPPEPLPAQNTVELQPDGPILVRGMIQVENDRSEWELQDLRMALCRCGASRQKPFCDGSHVARQFRSGPASFGNRRAAVPEAPAVGLLRIRRQKDGPVVFYGRFLLRDGDRELLLDGAHPFCRCGASRNKPFCDGTHGVAAFQAD